LDHLERSIVAGILVHILDYSLGLNIGYFDSNSGQSFGGNRADCQVD